MIVMNSNMKLLVVSVLGILVSYMVLVERIERVDSPRFAIKKV